MSMMSYLLIVLGLSVVMYSIYRYTFLKKPKNDLQKKPPFTLKIETE
jgi:hypothetical protein